MADEREILALAVIGDDPEVGRWLSALEDGRRETLRELERVTPAMVDWYPDAPLDSIGTLLYHIAIIEADWVVTEILEAGVPAELERLLPWPDRDGEGVAGTERRLSRVDGLSLESHLERLKPMTNTDFHRVRSFERYDAAPDWVIHHILQHEAEHRSHIAWLRDTYPRA
jgi:hypothetical protein